MADVVFKCLLLSKSYITKFLFPYIMKKRKLAAAVASNRLSMIARPLNPRAQILFSVVASLPRTWGLDSTDLISVQRRAPWVFNNWFVAAQRWEDIPDVEFLTSMELWVQFRGIPLPYVCEGTVRLVAERIGEVILVDYQESITPQITYIYQS